MLKSCWDDTKSLLEKTSPGYRNHIYRTITYAMHFLENAEEYERIVEAAFVYHDIGLWTDRKLAYLEPSEAVAIADNEKFGWGGWTLNCCAALSTGTTRFFPTMGLIKESSKPAVRRTGLMHRKACSARV